jgi:K+-transporting ATPase ATPase A chain
MSINSFLQIAVFFLIVAALTPLVGRYMAKVMEREKTWLQPLFGPVEKAIYRVCGVNPEYDMPWTVYTWALLLFSMAGCALTYVLLRVQGHLPFNPQGFNQTQMPPDLAFNTAVSFTTNTNWQSYTPESTVSYFSNMVALAIHNWMSAATGIAVAIALVRGLARRSAQGIGNFWVDVVRISLYVLLPICLIGGILYMGQGVPENFSPYTAVKTMEGAQQSIAQGPVASQEIIKMLGTNGGGFFNANSAHPFENPTPLCNLFQMLSIFIIPAGLTYTFGVIVGNHKEGWVIFAAMAIMFWVGALVCVHQEQAGVPAEARMGVMQPATDTQPGGNMEGKETRFGIAASGLFATVTTDASCGAVNSMHDSFTPLGGLVPLANIMSGEVIFGGVGSGLYGMLMYAVLAVFIAGLMVGRTPEYIGKKIEQFEVKMAMLACLVLAADILCFTAVGAHLVLGGNLNNFGAHGFSEILYAFTSCTGNNGSAFAGLTANTPVWNAMLGAAMFIGRFLMIIPLLAIAGSLARKKYVPPSAGTFPTDSPIFIVLLIGTVIIVGALTFFPAISLGPLVEHFQTWDPKQFTF